MELVKKFSYPQRPWNLAVSWQDEGVLTEAKLKKHAFEIGDLINWIPFDWDTFDEGKKAYTAYFGYDTKHDAIVANMRLDEEGHFRCLVFPIALPGRKL